MNYLSCIKMRLKKLIAVERMIYNTFRFPLFSINLYEFAAGICEFLPIMLRHIACIPFKPRTIIAKLFANDGFSGVLCLRIYHNRLDYKMITFSKNLSCCRVFVHCRSSFKSTW